METIRACPLCGGEANKEAFPYAIQFADQIFRYHRCKNCRTAFVNPLPDQACFAKMYDKANYHDAHYVDADASAYTLSVSLLRQYAPAGSTVLDYGCGVGQFLKAAKTYEFEPYGIEYDPAAASAASKAAECPVFCLDDLNDHPLDIAFDMIHFGDVLEHLPDPYSTLAGLLQWLKPGGLLHVEGPLEINPSPVYWAARAFGGLKHWLSPHQINPGIPTHLFRTSAHAQSTFFTEYFPQLKEEHWRVLETGWPYAQGQWLKRRVADLAVLLGGRRLLEFQLGNRFEAIHRLT